MSNRNNKTKKSCSSISSKSSLGQGYKYNLRTILKSRGSQHDLFNQNHKQIDNASRNHSQMSHHVKNRISTSMHLVDTHNKNNDIKDLQNSSLSHNITHNPQTITCQQQLICGSQPKYLYQEFMKKLEEIDKQAQILIEKKIHKICKKTNSITLKNKGKDQLSVQIENLISKIVNLKSENLEKFNVNEEQIKKFMDQKIKILQKFLAQNSTQSQVLKKYFFAISAINSQNKAAYRFNRCKKNKKSIFEPIPYRPYGSRMQQKQSFYKQILNHQIYPPPRPEQYQTYRYKRKDYTMNVQPLPRSQYKCEYLLYSPNKPQTKCKGIDHALFGTVNLHESTYAKDYQGLPAHVINYKDLQCYKNKYKNLQVSYAADNTNRKQQKQHYIEKNKNYLAEQVKMKYNYKYPKTMNKKNSQHNYHNLINTQTRREFKQHQQLYSSIAKNKNLNNLKYFYKNLIND